MRSSWKTLVATVAAVLVAPQLATADDVQDQLQLMQERMSQLEDKLQATDDQLEAANRKVEQQERVIEGAGLGDRSGSSWLSSFLSQTTFDGFVAASYIYNFNDPSDSRVASDFCLGTSAAAAFIPPPFSPGTICGENTGLLGNVAPHHQNANNFQVDQVWFGMEKLATADSRGGFRVDIVYGAAADAQRPQQTILGFNLGGVNGMNTGDLPHVYQAYAQYLAPITESGLSIKAGRYETIIGAESFRMDSKGGNFNVTRGILWGMQPVNHTGVLVEGNCADCGIDYAFGISNNFGNTESDTDNAKTGLARIRWTGETASLAVAGLLGGDTDQGYAGTLGGISFQNGKFTSGVGRDADAIPMLDVVATWDPSESLSAWINYTHQFDPINGNVRQDISLWGIAAAARYAITEATGIATRVEFMQYNSIFQNIGPGSGDMDQWSVTTTLDHALTDHLTVKLEGRWDLLNIEGAPDDSFICKNDPASPSCNPGNGSGLGLVPDYNQDSQFLALVQLLYEF